MIPPSYQTQDEKSNSGDYESEPLGLEKIEKKVCVNNTNNNSNNNIKQNNNNEDNKNF